MLGGVEPGAPGGGAGLDGDGAGLFLGKEEEEEEAEKKKSKGSDCDEQKRLDLSPPPNRTLWDVGCIPLARETVGVIKKGASA